MWREGSSRHQSKKQGGPETFGYGYFLEKNPKSNAPPSIFTLAQLPQERSNENLFS